MRSSLARSIQCYLFIRSQRIISLLNSAATEHWDLKLSRFLRW